MKAVAEGEPGVRRQDTISRGLGSAARAIGLTTDALRPSGYASPVAQANRFLRLPTAFADIRGRFARPIGYGEALRYGIFDTAYTRPGDYLVRADATWFIAGQPHLLPALCVLTNRVVDILRPSAPAGQGIAGYSGVDRDALAAVLSAWPASVLGAAGGGRDEADLQAGSQVPVWTVLLPAIKGRVILPADLVRDDLGRVASVSGAELTELGWRITARQVTA